MSVGHYGGDDQKDRHACKEKDTGFIIILFILKKEEDHHGRHIRKPQKVRNDEDLAERDVIIYGKVDHLIEPGGIHFQIVEPRQIDDSVQ